MATWREGDKRTRERGKSKRVREGGRASSPFIVGQANLAVVVR